MRGEDPQLDLNSPRMRVEVPSGKQERWKLASKCKSCNNKYVMVYEEESRYLKEQTPFRCKHNKLKLDKGKESEMSRLEGLFPNDNGAFATLSPRAG